MIDKAEARVPVQLPGKEHPINCHAVVETNVGFGGETVLTISDWAFSKNLMTLMKSDQLVTMHIQLQVKPAEPEE